MRKNFLFTFCTFVFSSLLLPVFANAHEVYVLSPDIVTEALSKPSFSFLEVISQNVGNFFLWGIIVIVVIFTVFFISISRSVEQIFDPILAKLPPYAPVISRVTIGLSFLAAAYYQALFGPELPLVQTFGFLTPLVTGILTIAGIMIIFGVYARIAALCIAVLFIVEIYTHGIYLLTYANYAGELILLVILGAHKLAFHHKEHDAVRAPQWFLTVKEKFTPYAFLILRVAFGLSLLYASLYAKIFNNQLAVAVTQQYPALLQFFGFEAHFLVLGAAIIEIIIGTFFVLGIEIRFTALFVLFWLSLSLWYFGESVWPHIILIGIPISFIFYGYDKYSLEGYFFKREGREPVL